MVPGTTATRSLPAWCATSRFRQIMRMIRRYLPRLTVEARYGHSAAAQPAPPGPMARRDVGHSKTPLRATGFPTRIRMPMPWRPTGRPAIRLGSERRRAFIESKAASYGKQCRIAARRLFPDRWASSSFADDSTVFIGTHTGSAYPTQVTCADGKTVPNRGLFSSVNAGMNWESTGLQNVAVDSIAVSPNYTADGTVFAGSAVNGLYKSTDKGVHFSAVKVVSGDNGILPVVFSPAYATDQTVFTGTSHSGIYKSTNGGSAWTLLPGTALGLPPSRSLSRRITRAIRLCSSARCNRDC